MSNILGKDIYKLYLDNMCKDCTYDFSSLFILDMDSILDLSSRMTDLLLLQDIMGDTGVNIDIFRSNSYLSKDIDVEKEKKQLITRISSKYGEDNPYVQMMRDMNMTTPKALDGLNKFLDDIEPYENIGFKSSSLTSISNGASKELEELQILLNSSILEKKSKKVNFNKGVVLTPTPKTPIYADVNKNTKLNSIDLDTNIVHNKGIPEKQNEYDDFVVDLSKPTEVIENTSFDKNYIHEVGSKSASMFLGGDSDIETSTETDAEIEDDEVYTTDEDLYNTDAENIHVGISKFDDVNYKEELYSDELDEDELEELDADFEFLYMLSDELEDPVDMSESALFEGFSAEENAKRIEELKVELNLLFGDVENSDPVTQSRQKVANELLKKVLLTENDMELIRDTYTTKEKVVNSESDLSNAVFKKILKFGDKLIGLPTESVKLWGKLDLKERVSSLKVEEE